MTLAPFTESVVEQSALAWFESAGWSVKNGGWDALPNHYPVVELVGADLRVRPFAGHDESGAHIGAPLPGIV